MLRISSLSKPYIHSFITGALGTETVEIAMIQAAEPISGDWKTASWGAVTPTGAWAKILIGPSTTLALTDGVYQVWVRATGATEQPVLHSGEIEIT